MNISTNVYRFGGHVSTFLHSGGWNVASASDSTYQRAPQGRGHEKYPDNCPKGVYVCVYTFIKVHKFISLGLLILYR